MKAKKTLHKRMPVSDAAREFGVNYRTMTSAISDALHEGKFKQAKKYTIQECHIALSGDKRMAEMRALQAKTALMEHELAVNKREVISREEVAKFILDTFSPLREMAVALPGQLSPLVNPSDPVVSRQHLERWRDDFLRLKPSLPEGNEKC